MAQLKKSVLEKLRQDESLQQKMSAAMVKRISTIKSWLRYNDVILTSKAVLLVIQDLTGLSEEEILEKQPETV